MKVEDIKVLDDMEEAINKYANDFDPCPRCAHNTAAGHVGICHDCAYFYPGLFKARRES